MKGGYLEFINALGKRESSNDYACVNAFGFLGRWQFGKPRLWDLGYSINGYKPKGGIEKNVISVKDFLVNHPLQDRLMFKHVSALRMLIRKKYSKYLGKTIGGVVITESGMVAGLHLKGEGNDRSPGLKQFLESGQSNVDGLGTEITEYIEKFGGYDLRSLPEKILNETDIMKELEKLQPRPVELIK